MGRKFLRPFSFFVIWCWCGPLGRAEVVLLTAAPVVRKGQVAACCNVISKRAVVNTGIFHSFFTDVHSVMNKHSNSCRRILHRTGSATLGRVSRRTHRVNTGTIVKISLSCRAIKKDNDVLVMATDKATMFLR